MAYDNAISMIIIGNERDRAIVALAFMSALPRPTGAVKIRI